MGIPDRMDKSDHANLLELQFEGISSSKLLFIISL